mmetsp:Transcript_6654/g.7597  ORF Transcript_6654/g.7597 Transcript_6654/m.7597 type:complete len:219 (-) Transcript_6654:558-1214(-)
MLLDQDQFMRFLNVLHIKLLHFLGKIFFNAVFSFLFREEVFLLIGDHLKLILGLLELLAEEILEHFDVLGLLVQYLRVDVVLRDRPLHPVDPLVHLALLRDQHSASFVQELIEFVHVHEVVEVRVAVHLSRACARETVRSRPCWLTCFRRNFGNIFKFIFKICICIASFGLFVIYNFFVLQFDPDFCFFGGFVLADFGGSAKVDQIAFFILDLVVRRK